MQASQILYFLLLQSNGGILPLPQPYSLFFEVHDLTYLLK
jgi:hypothetical protein